MKAMKASTYSSDGLEPSLQDSTESRYQRNSSKEEPFTDAVLSELKKQSTNGCLLCALEDLDEEEWE